MKKMVNEVTRYIKRGVERELWARAAGRCQFDGCNKLLYKSTVTQETVNLAQKAHIYSFSKKGPRGWGPFSINTKGLNEVVNLMLMCHGCHKNIDQDDKGERYSAELLIDWKHEHEKQVEIVTGIRSEKKTNVVLYAVNIGSEKSPINYISCIEAIFPDWYPACERPVLLSTKSELNDNSSVYWEAESEHLYKSYERNIAPLIDQEKCKHFSIFALAPQPLLIQLGALFTDKVSVEVYQPQREPKGWSWIEPASNFDFIINEPSNSDGIAVLLISLSDHVSNDRVNEVLGSNTSIWELTIDTPNNDFMKSKYQLSLFRKYLRRLMVDIKKKNGNTKELHVFPVMPVSCAIELGRIRMPKADMPWVIYDQNPSSGKFIDSIKICGDIHVRKS